MTSAKRPPSEFQLSLESFEFKNTFHSRITHRLQTVSYDY